LKLDPKQAERQELVQLHELELEGDHGETGVSDADFDG
jgi:hypothetical protein